MYESVKEIVKEIQSSGCSWIREDNDNYYVALVAENEQDDSLWIVNKKTKQVTYMSVLLFLIDPVDGEKSLADVTKIVKVETFLKENLS